MGRLRCHRQVSLVQIETFSCIVPYLDLPSPKRDQLNSFSSLYDRAHGNEPPPYFLVNRDWQDWLA